MPKKTEREDPLGFFNIHSVAKIRKKLKGGPFGGKKIGKKSHIAEKNLKGGYFGIVRYCMLRGKPFWLSSLGQQVKFCRAFGKTILVTSGILEKTLTKSHDYSRLFSGKVPTKNTTQNQQKRLPNAESHLHCRVARENKTRVPLKN